MIKFDFCSDLHVDAWHHTTRLVHAPGEGPQSRDKDGEFQYVDWSWFKNDDSTVLVIAGDTSNEIAVTADVFISAAKVYEWVVVVDGNHEHYDSEYSVSENIQRLRERLAPHKNIVFLTGDSFKLGDTLFVGATGWYDWACWEHRGISFDKAYWYWNDCSNDSRIPRFRELTGPKQLAATHAVNLAEEVRKAQTDDSIKSIVCVTHTSPRWELMYWHPTNERWNGLTPSYVNTMMSGVLEADVNKKIRYWVYGHTHQRLMKTIDGVTYCNNAQGYPRENEGWFLPQIEV